MPREIFQERLEDALGQERWIIDGNYNRTMEMRMQAVEIADDVAKKQLKIVQDIASLLGETAADTFIAINRLKETISDD